MRDEVELAGFEWGNGMSWMLAGGKEDGDDFFFGEDGMLGGDAICGGRGFGR